MPCIEGLKARCTKGWRYLKLKPEFPTQLSADIGDGNTVMVRNDSCLEMAGYLGFLRYNQVFPVVFL